MKKLRFKRQKRLMYIAGSLLALIALAFMFIAPEAGMSMTALATIPIWGTVKDKTFKELSADEVAKLEVEDQIKYFNELNLYKAEQLEDLKAQLKKEASEDLNKQIKDLREEIQSDNLEQMKALRSASVAQGNAIKKLMDTESGREKVNVMKKTITDAFPSIQKAVSENGGSYKFRIEEEALKTTVGLASITSDPNGMMIPGFAHVQSQANRLAPSLTLFQLTPDDHGVIRWVDMTTRTTNAAARSDGDAAGEQVYEWTGYSETVDNISAMIPVHKEALKHISIMENELKVLLNDDCQVALDGYCYTGSGTAPQIGGVYTRATAFDAAAFIAAGGFQPEKANLYDLIVSMAANIMKGTKYNVDRAWINPYDALKMKLNKDDNGVYTMPPFVIPSVNGPITVSNMQVIEANSVTAGTCVVGDSTKARLYSTGAAEIEVGYNLTGDFGKRILTILANMEVSLLIRNAEVNAFLKSTDIDDDINAITAGA